MKKRYVVLIAAALVLFLVSAAAQSGLHADIQHETDSPGWVSELPAAQEAPQLLVVAGIGMDKTTAYISMHRKDESGAWKQVLSTPGFVGKNGLCADADHREGCAQTPIGVYHFNKAFGIAPDPGCNIPYIQADDNTYWSGDPDRQYNRMVDIRDVPELAMDDSEHIMDYEYQYRYCLNISFNEEGTPGRGSAIFLHCFGLQKPWTGGCVAVPENIMKRTYYYAEEDFLPDTYEQARTRVFEQAYLVFRNARWDKEVVLAWSKAKVDLFADNITLMPQEWSVELAMQSADSLYTKAKSVEKAYLAWTGIRDRYVNIDSVARKATFEIAHILSDKENFDKAQREYRAFYKTWPDSPDAEKAMFSRGFILTENMHKDSLALEVFEEFKKLYPKSELTESVDWLVQNIKSNGKLADELMKKIEAEE